MTVGSCWFGGIWDGHLHKPTHFFIMQIKTYIQSMSKALYGGVLSLMQQYSPAPSTQMAQSLNPAYCLLSSGNLSLSVEKLFISCVSRGRDKALRVYREAWCSLRLLSVCMQPSQTSSDILTNISTRFAVETWLFVLFVRYLFLILSIISI